MEDPLYPEIEVLAEIEHAQWMAWAKSLMDTESLSPKRLARWTPLMVPYSELSEDMKEHDRKWAKAAYYALEVHWAKA